ncbi:NAD-dependent epimerase/dehydratase family protein [Paracoccus lutimaris]|uniref:UDP-glucose 4-epimerase n=1 Tax=Paracoccus lutimaris TaxID=1490030 RepID=A0A368YLH4_9RHOB|nr:NAD-dependent epimerase/dehydratase family protein [Paracoccus lutimaris]RCW81070.1 UDP-glucose 4-epimerase [Paracoccus lutimaris]
MKLLRVGGQAELIVLLFGLGLIGGAVDRALRLRFQAEARDFPYDWQDASLQQAQRAAIRAALPAKTRVAMVWTGGQSGFGSSDADMGQETATIAELIAMAEDLRHERPVDFHMMSSAGGLFESQTHCSEHSLPLPLRPYGTGKLMQEARLEQAASLDRRHVYRPSSVYGVTRSKRVGLVTALISNAMQGKTTRIFGNPNTLRDYVLSDDIGHYMARRIVDPDPAPRAATFLLASGRSASVFEVIERIRERIERPLLLQFDPHPSNVRDMSFLPSALPPDWQPTSLASGISRIITFLRSGLA